MTYYPATTRGYMLTVRMTNKDKEKLERIAAAEKLTRSDVMLQLLRSHVDAKDGIDDPYSLNAALNAVDDYYYKDIPLEKEAAHNVLHFLRGYDTVIKLMAELGDKLNTTARAMSV